MAESLPKEYGLVIGAFGASWFVNWYLSVLVMKARKVYGVEYPAL